jgi:importin subunit beta-1
MEREFKEFIKEAVLSSLACQSSIVRKQVASAIASIASIEIPRQEWLEIIPNLCNNSANDSLDIRHAALETLGFICEELVPDDLTNEMKSLVIQALTRNISLDPALIKTTLLATRALYQALPYASPNF